MIGCDVASWFDYPRRALYMECGSEPNLASVLPLLQAKERKEEEKRLKKAKAEAERRRQQQQSSGPSMVCCVQRISVPIGCPRAVLERGVHRIAHCRAGAAWAAWVAWGEWSRCSPPSSWSCCRRYACVARYLCANRVAPWSMPTWVFADSLYMRAVLKKNEGRSGIASS
jgi:hypothetical protein